VRGRFEQIAEHEASHVAFLTKALGEKAPEACTYSFLGAAKYISNKVSLCSSARCWQPRANVDAGLLDGGGVDLDD
jgi:hypothetical protein